MRRKMSGLLSLGLAFALTVSMLSGCGSQPAADSGAGQEESAAKHRIRQQRIRALRTRRRQMTRRQNRSRSSFGTAGRVRTGNC